jgi:pimeloyl-ACP methyl ester carboxylesterase
VHRSLHHWFTLLAVVTLIGAAGAAHAGPPPTRPDGLWLGTLETGPAKLRIVFHIDHTPDGALHATLDSPDQGVTGLPVATVSYEASTLKLELTKPPARFEGKLTGDRLVGTWNQGAALPLVLSRVDKIDAPRRPQEPVRPFPYKEEPVTISVLAAPRDRANTDRITLAGTLTLPPGKGPFAAVVFITGSGSQDRDETVFGHKPFLVLSDALTRRGIATLRVDDRGTGASTGTAEASTTLDFAEDVKAELAWLAARPEIDRRAIGVIGHSEGGVIGPIVGATSELARFVVMLAGTGMPGDQILLEQSALIARAIGEPGDKIKRDTADAEALFRKVRAAKTDADLEAAVAAYVAAVPAYKAERASIEKLLRSPWGRAFVTLDPVGYLQKLRVPVLAISGDLDLQVPKDNIPLIEAALRRGHNPDATVKLLPGLNHLFQHTRTGAPTEYGTIEESFAPEAVKLVGDWIVERTTRLRKP